MSELLVLALVSTVLSGTAGGSINATILAYSPVGQNVTVNNETILISAEKTVTFNIEVPIEAGTHTKILQVYTDTTIYDLPVTVVGHRNLRKLWWLAGLPIVGALFAVRIRRSSPKH